MTYKIHECQIECFTDLANKTVFILFDWVFKDCLLCCHCFAFTISCLMFYIEILYLLQFLVLTWGRTPWKFLTDDLVFISKIFTIYYFCVYLIGDIFSRWACVVQVWNIILLNKHLFGDFLDLLNLRVTFGLLGKFLITISLDVIYVWTVELYPTQIRYVLLCFSFFTYLM